MDHKYSLINLKCLSAWFLGPRMSLCRLPRTLGHLALGEHYSCPSVTWHQHRMMRPLLICLLVPKHHCLVGTKQQWAQIPRNMGALIFVTCPAQLSTVTLQKEEEFSLCLLLHLSHGDCCVDCKQHLHQKVVLWVNDCPCYGSGWDAVEWALTLWICPVLVHPLKSSTPAVSAVSKCHQTCMSVKIHGHFQLLQLQALPFLLCRWSQYSFICVLTIQEHL